MQTAMVHHPRKEQKFVPRKPSEHPSKRESRRSRITALLLGQTGLVWFICCFAKYAEAVVTFIILTPFYYYY
jgi:hypothetical protein